MLVELTFFAFLHFLFFHLFTIPAAGRGGGNEVVVVVLGARASYTLSVHDISVTITTAPNCLHGTQILAFQHFLQVRAGTAGLSMIVSPGHKAVKALWVRSKR